MKYDVVGLGQCCVDYLGTVGHYPDVNEKVEVEDLTIQGGGPVATAMVTLARLGVPTTFIGKISDDYFGGLIKESLIEENVNIDHIVIEKGKRSQFANIVIEKNTGKRNIFWSRATVSTLRPEEINMDIIKDAKVLHLDELMIEGPLAAAGCAVDAGVKIVVDAGSLKEGSLKFAKIADYYVASEEFAKDYYSKGGPEDAARQILKLGAKVVIVTLGERGCIVATKDDYFHQPAFKIKAVDTTGCGDVFHGAFTYGVLQDWGLKTTVKFASAAAALKCRKIGGRTAIPNLKEVEEFLKNGQ